MTDRGDGERLDQIASLDLLCWHIDRCDRSRASLAARSNAVLSATAVLITGEAFLANHYFVTDHALVWNALTIATLAVSLGLALCCGWSAMITLVNPGTKPEAKDVGLDRGVFGWPTAVNNYREDDGSAPARFAEDMIESPLYAATLREGALELWVSIHNHKQRYRHLQRAIRILRLCAMSFAALAVLALASPTTSKSQPQRDGTVGTPVTTTTAP